MLIRTARIPLFLIASLALSGPAWGCAHCRFSLEANPFLVAVFLTFAISFFAKWILKRSGPRPARLIIYLQVAVFTAAYCALKYEMHRVPTPAGKFFYNFLLTAPIPGKDSILGSSELVRELQSGLVVGGALIGLLFMKLNTQQPKWTAVPYALAILMIPFLFMAMGTAYMLPTHTFFDASDRIDQSFLAFKLALIPIAILSYYKKFFLIVSIIVSVLCLLAGAPTKSVGIMLAILLTLGFYAVGQLIEDAGRKKLAIQALNQHDLESKS